MTEEQPGGTTPETEATASVADQASEEAVGVAIADEPAEIIETATIETSEPPAPAAPEPVAVAEAEVAEAEVAEAEVAEAEVADAPAAEFVAVTEAEVADAPAAEEQEPEEVPVPVVARPEPSTMEELLAEQDADIKSFKHGDVVEGTVVRIDRDEILVDIGAKSEGVVSNRELYGRHAESAPQLAVGDVVLVYVLQPESQEGHVVLSLRRAGLERKWRSMQEQFEPSVGLCRVPHRLHFTACGVLRGDLRRRHRPSGLEGVAESPHRVDQDWVGGVLFHLLPQAQNVHVHGAIGDGVVLTPHRVQ